MRARTRLIQTLNDHDASPEYFLLMQLAVIQFTGDRSGRIGTKARPVDGTLEHKIEERRRMLISRGEIQFPCRIAISIDLPLD